MTPPALATYSAVYPHAGQLRRLWFDAADAGEAVAHAARWGAGLEFSNRLGLVTGVRVAHAARWGAGLEGPATRPALQPAVAAEAYDQATARRLLGGISRVTLYKWLVLGLLERVGGTRRLLVTRRSIEARCRS